MSLPPGFLDELRDRTSIAQVVGRKVSWDSRKSNPGKGDYWAPCPFHQEKTASFHVDDRKGFYYCFGCHAKGDALGFVRETENLGFMEAVELLAGEAGLQMPARDPKAAERADRREQLAAVMERAVRFYRLQLATAAARPARDYLDKRGLDEPARGRYEIGFAPDTRTALAQHLREAGVDEALSIEAGLIAKPEQGGAPYDRFRGRIIFPIRDARGRAIALGGRALDPNARAKYLNSPETPLFDKSRALYHVGPAREAAGKTGRLIVAEGYMDVIALAEHGFRDTVAPLGTAITEPQLQMMWRIADEPIIALDGDTAGLRAAMRVIDLALPLLQAGKGLRFCLMPEGLDPDDLLRAQGPNAMAELLAGALPMVGLLWRRETEGKVFDSPERRAALDADLRKAIGLIRDPSIRDHYRAAIRDLRSDLFAPRTRPGFKTKGRWQRRDFGPAAGPLASTRSSLLAQAGQDAQGAARIRESAILAGCLNHPQIARTLESQLEDLSFVCPDLDSLRRTLLQALADTLNADSSDSEAAGFLAHIARATGNDPMSRLMRIGQVRDNPHLAVSADPGNARTAIEEEIAKQRAIYGAAVELRDAEEEINGVADEGLTWRLQKAAEARELSRRRTTPEGDTAEDEDADLSAHLQSLIDAQIWVKRKK